MPEIDEWSKQYQSIRQTFIARARRARLLAYSILGLICALLGGAATVFLLPQQFSATVSSDPLALRENIDARIKEAKSSFAEKTVGLRSNLDELRRLLDQEKYENSSNAISVTLELDDYASAESILSKIDSALKAASSDGRFIGFRLVEIDLEFRGSSATGYRTISREALDGLMSKFKSAAFTSVPRETLASIKSLKSQGEAFYSVLNTVDLLAKEQEVSKIIGQKVSLFSGIAGNQSKDWAAIIEPNITRFGTMIIVSFLVGILSPLYRYNIRIAAFYDARADALDFLRTSVRSNGFVRLAGSLTPNMDFGKQPQTPIEQVIELARLISAKGGHRKEADGE